MFPEFYFGGFYDDVKVTGGEISCQLFHEVHANDAKLVAHWRAAPKRTSKVLHPGNCKQSVSVSLSVFFHESTCDQVLLPGKGRCLRFLNLFNVW